MHAWIESGQLDRDLSSGASRYSPRPGVAHKLDPYKELIEVRLEEFPKLSAKRLFDEVRAAGYDRGYSRVRDFVREVRPRAPEEAPVRFETPETSGCQLSLPPIIGASRIGGGVLGDEIMAAALIDRLLHHCHVVNIRGNSYRMRRAHQDLLRPAHEERRQETAS